MKSIRVLTAVAVATGFGSSGCNLCGPEQHAITTSASALTVSGEGFSHQVPFNVRLTQPPATEDQFDFVFNTLEGSTNGEGVALSFTGTDPGTQEVITLVLALPVALREGDVYQVGANFTVEVGSNTETRLWGGHDLQQSNKADVALVVANYTFPPPTYTPTYRAVTSAGTIRVVGRSQGHVQLDLNLSFTDSSGKTRTITGNAQSNTEKFAATCN